MWRWREVKVAVEIVPTLPQRFVLQQAPAGAGNNGVLRVKPIAQLARVGFHADRGCLRGREQR
jgi:hypothetical protein